MGKNQQHNLHLQSHNSRISIDFFLHFSMNVNWNSVEFKVHFSCKITNWNWEIFWCTNHSLFYESMRNPAQSSSAFNFETSQNIISFMKWILCDFSSKITKLTKYFEWTNCTVFIYLQKHNHIKQIEIKPIEIFENKTAYWHFDIPNVPKYSNGRIRQTFKVDL